MTRTQAFTLFVALGVGVGLAGAARRTPEPWLVNETASLPPGVYVRTAEPARPGAIITLSPPPLARGYLSALGAPPDARLLKRVAAGPGETVCRDARRLSWPRGTVAALIRDRRGRPLPAWRGCRRLGPDELIVVGDSAASFDSRYFGPVRLTAVDGVYREVWRW